MAICDKIFKKHTYTPERIVLAGFKELKNSPLLVSFSYGKGEVIYTSFHNHAQADEKQEILLNYLVLKSLSSASKIPVLVLAKQKGMLQ